MITRILIEITEEPERVAWVIGFLQIGEQTKRQFSAALIFSYGLESLPLRAEAMVLDRAV